MSEYRGFIKKMVEDVGKNIDLGTSGGMQKIKSATLDIVVKDASQIKMFDALINECKAKNLNIKINVRVIQ